MLSNQSSAVICRGEYVTNCWSILDFRTKCCILLRLWVVFTSNCSKPVFWAHLTSPCLPIYLIIYLSDYLTSWFDLIWPPHQNNRGRSMTCQDTALRKHLPALNKPCFLLPSRRFTILLTPLIPSPAWTPLFQQPLNRLFKVNHDTYRM